MAATVFGVWALGFMIAMHALESKSRHVVAAFAASKRVVEQLRLPREPGRSASLKASGRSSSADTPGQA